MESSPCLRFHQPSFTRLCRQMLGAEQLKLSYWKTHSMNIEDADVPGLQTQRDTIAFFPFFLRLLEWSGLCYTSVFCPIRLWSFLVQLLPFSVRHAVRFLMSLYQVSRLSPLLRVMLCHYQFSSLPRHLMLHEVISYAIIKCDLLV